MATMRVIRLENVTGYRLGIHLVPELDEVTVHLSEALLGKEKVDLMVTMMDVGLEK